MAPEMDPEAPKGEFHNPEAARVAADNPSVDSMRHMAGKLNQAVGGRWVGEGGCRGQGHIVTGEVSAGDVRTRYFW
jgi:hypothetical protein